MPFIRYDSSQGAGMLEPIFYAQLAVSIVAGVEVWLTRDAPVLALAAGLALFVLLTVLLFHTKTRRLSAGVGTLMGTGAAALCGQLLTGPAHWGGFLGGLVGLVVMAGCYRQLFHVGVD